MIKLITFLDNKVSVVDVKAHDADDSLYQIPLLPDPLCQASCRLHLVELYPQGGEDERSVPRYSDERKETVRRKMLPPHNRALAELAAEEGISEGTLYDWRRDARDQGRRGCPTAPPAPRAGARQTSSPPWLRARR